MKQMIKNYLPIVISAALLFLLAACMAPIKDSMLETSNKNILGEAIYDGVLYKITDETTGCAFEDDQEFVDAILISPDETPNENYECSVPGSQAQFTVFEDHLMLIVDGEQHILSQQ